MYPLMNKLILVMKPERSYTKFPLMQSHQKMQSEDGYA
jgi:hypothetical protein